MYRVVRRTGDIFGDEPHVCEFVCDTSDDVATLPTSIAEGTGGKSKYDNQKCSAGSTVHIVSETENKSYMLNNQDNWIEQKLSVISNGNGNENNESNNLLPKPYGLTDYFDYQYNADVNKKTWGSICGDRILTNNGFSKNNECLSLADKFITECNDDIYAHSIYTIFQSTKIVSGWSGVICGYGNAPQFNICTNNGRLAIGTGSTYGSYTSNVWGYDEWHVCCITLNNGFGTFYIDGNKEYEYNGYTIPQFGANIPLHIGESVVNIKMLAICKATHGKNTVYENSMHLKTKYDI